MVIATLFLSILGNSKGQTVLPFETVARGSYSAIDEPMSLVIRTEEEMDEFWKKHKANQSSSLKIPSIDFDKEMVICMFWGTKNTGGYSIEVTQILSYGSDIIVSYEASPPPEEAMVTMALTQPYHIVKMTALDLPVNFEGNLEESDSEIFSLSKDDASGGKIRAGGVLQIAVALLLALRFYFD